MRRIAEFCYSASRPIIIIVAIINIVALISFFRFELDTDILNFFTTGNIKAQQYDDLKAKYSTGEAISILVEQDNSLIEKENLKKVLFLKEEIESLPGIFKVDSFIPTEITIGVTEYRIDERFIEHHFDTIEEYIKINRNLIDNALSADNSRTILIATLDYNAVPEHVVQSLRSIAEKERSWTISLAGDQVIQDTLWDYLIRIILTLPPCAAFLVLFVFSRILRSKKFTVLSMIPAAFGALWTFGTIFWSGSGLNLVTIISPIFILVMGAADGLHYTSHFIENMKKFSDRRQLTIETLDMVGMPIVLTSITTIAGFASLCWTDMVPMRQMGIFVSLGIFYAGLLSLFFLPAVLSRIELPSQTQSEKESTLPGLMLAVSKHKVPIIAAFSAIIIISALYIPKLDVVSNQLMFFREDSAIRQTFDKIEYYFGGALPLTAEIVAERGILTLRDYRYADTVLDIEREIERLPGVQSVFSPFDMIVNISKSITGKSDYPENPQFIQMLIKRIDYEDLEGLVSPDGLKMVIRTENLDDLNIDLLEGMIADHPEIRLVTGMPVLFNEMNKLVVESQIRSLCLALVLIFIVLLISIRKVKAALVALLPVVITIAAILGMLSITGFHLNVMTANLSAISVGVGIDYSIHLIYGIYYFRNRGQGLNESTNSAIVSVSRPILANAFGLAIGLSVFYLSPLRIHMHVASIMWVAMIISSTGALLLIPLFYSKRKK